MKHISEILQKHQQGYSIETIQRNYHYTAEQLAEVISQSEIEIQTEQFYIVPSKLNYL
jgi:uncharacterized protein (DUF433 family)